MPAFNVTFSIGAPTGTGGPSGAGGRLAPETIQKTIRADFGSMRQCYEKALAKKADLRGRITVAFTIERDGSVSNAELAPSADALVDPVVTACVVARFAALKFPRPDGGIVKVVYPIIFNAAD